MAQFRLLRSRLKSIVLGGSENSSLLLRPGALLVFVAIKLSADVYFSKIDSLFSLRGFFDGLLLSEMRLTLLGGI